MSLLIYQCLDGEVVDLEYENAITTAWNNTPPLIGEVVSMGGENRWKVIDVSLYESAGLFAPTESIYLIQVHPENMPLPSRENWLCYLFKDEHPNESIFIYLTDETIEVGFDMNGNHPEVGYQLESFEPIGNTTSMRSILRPWIVDRVITYHHVGYAPYYKIDVCLCCELALVA